MSVPSYCELCHEQLQDCGPLCAGCRTLRSEDMPVRVFPSIWEARPDEQIPVKPLGDMSFEELSGHPSRDNLSDDYR